jgi:hypothetical protein
VTDEILESIEQILFQNRIDALNRQRRAIERKLSEAELMIGLALANIEDTSIQLDTTEKRLGGV